MNSDTGPYPSPVLAWATSISEAVARSLPYMNVPVFMPPRSPSRAYKGWTGRSTPPSPKAIKAKRAQRAARKRNR